MKIATVAPLLTTALASLSDAPPPGFENWLRNLLYVAGIAWFVWGMIEKAKRKPSLDVELSHVATKEELAKAIAHLDEERRRSSTAIYNQLKAQDKAAADLHAENKGQLATLNERTETHTRQFANLEMKIDNMPGRILAMLPQPPRRS